MIQLKFLVSPDEDAIAECIWHVNSLWLGRSKKAQIMLEDPECSLMHVHLTVDAKGAFCDLGPKAPQFHLNGKKIVGRKFLKAGDKIKIGGTELQLVKYEYRPVPDIRSEMEKHYLELIKVSPGHQAFLDRIEREILALERELHA